MKKTKFTPMCKQIFFQIISISVFLFLVSCKKDQLHFSHIHKLNSHTNCRINHVKFITNNIAIASGGTQFLQSVILKSTDGGNIWTDTSIAAAPKEMFGMDVGANGNIYLAGVDGDVLISPDTGKTWQFRRINTWLQQSGGTFPVNDTGVFVSTVLQRACTICRVYSSYNSSDSSFNIIDQQTFPFGANNLKFTSPDTGYLMGYGTLMKTYDRGNSWHFLDVKNDNFMAMSFLGNEVWMCGYNSSIYHSYNAGNTWITERNGNDFTFPHHGLLDILFTDRLHGWITCDDGTILYTKDAGNDWMEYEKFTSNSLRSICVCPNNDLLVVGDNGSIYRITP